MGGEVAAEPVGSLQMALAHATRLLQKDPRLAAEQAAEILRAVPAEPRARLVLGAAHRLTGQLQAALEVLEPLARERRRAAAVHLERGTARGEANRAHEATAALRRAVELQPDSPDGWRLLADQCDARGDAHAADQARARYLRAATRDPRLMGAAAALVENNLPVADARLRAHLQAHPTDVAALRMLAEVAGRLRRYLDAQQLLERCLELAPSFDAARYNYAWVLTRQGNPAAALSQAERLLATEPPGSFRHHSQVKSLRFLLPLGAGAMSLLLLASGGCVSSDDIDGLLREPDYDAIVRTWAERSGRRTGPSLHQAPG
jgi:predicted Zn-dependent protease